MHCTPKLKPMHLAGIALALLSTFGTAPAHAGEVYANLGLPGIGLGYAHPIDSHFTVRGDFMTMGSRQKDTTEDGIAYPVMQRAKAAVERFNKEEKIDQFINTEIVPKDGGDYSVVLELNDETGAIMRLELMAPTQQQARALAKAFRTRADQIYQGILSGLLKKKQPENDANV